MRVLLIQPPVQDFYDTDVRLQPIGLAYIKAAVRKHLPDVEVIVKDYHGGHGRRTVPIPKELRYLTEVLSRRRQVAVLDFSSVLSLRQTV